MTDSNKYINIILARLLLFIDNLLETFNSSEMIQVIEKHAFIFMLYSTSYYKVKEILDLLKEEKTSVIDLLVQSLGLNPLENL